MSLVLDSRPTSRLQALALPFLLVALAFAPWTGAAAESKSTKPASTQKSTKPTKASPATAQTGKKNPNAISRDPYIGAVAIDAATGRILVEDRGEARGYPASCLKLMDLLIILEKVDAHLLNFQDTVTVSAKSAKTGGSQVWLAEKEVFTVEDLLFALMVQSANDAAVALAEKAAGTTDAFVELMNRRARELGMNNTLFHSVHGLPPGAGQQPDVTTPRDFAILCRELVKRPEVLTLTSTRERQFRPNGGDKMVVMRTHNHLLGAVDGCDGLKTGYFVNAGYSIAATAQRNGQRVIVVVLGSTDRKTRDAKATELIAKAFAAQAAATTPPPTASATAPAASRNSTPNPTNSAASRTR